jgi:hypothetical protein
MISAFSALMRLFFSEVSQMESLEFINALPLKKTPSFMTGMI